MEELENLQNKINLKIEKGENASADLKTFRLKLRNFKLDNWDHPKVKSFELWFVKLKPTGNTVQVLEQGIEVQEESKIALQETIQISSNTVEIGREILEEQKVQNEKLERIDKKFEEFDYSLKKAGKSLFGLARTKQKDKILLSIICLLAITFLILVILNSSCLIGC